MASNSLIKYKVFSQADISIEQISSVEDIQFLDNVGIQINITSGTPTGVFYVEVSADYSISLPSHTVTDPGTWASIAQPVITAGSPSVTILNVNQIPFSFIRLHYIPTSDSGTCDAYFVGKSI